MTKKNEERRRSRRINISADALISILIPDETTVPRSFRGAANEISLHGLRLKSYQISLEHVFVFAEREHYARISLSLPYLRSDMNLRSRIAWAEHLQDLDSATEYALLGVEFVDISREMQNDLQYVMEKLSSESYDAIPRLDRPHRGKN